MKIAVCSKGNDLNSLCDERFERNRNHYFKM